MSLLYWLYGHPSPSRPYTLTVGLRSRVYKPFTQEILTLPMSVFRSLKTNLWILRIGLKEDNKLPTIEVVENKRYGREDLWMVLLELYVRRRYIRGLWVTYGRYASITFHYYLLNNVLSSTVHGTPKSFPSLVKYISTFLHPVSSGTTPPPYSRLATVYHPKLVLVDPSSSSSYGHLTTFVSVVVVLVPSHRTFYPVTPSVSSVLFLHSSRVFLLGVRFKRWLYHPSFHYSTCLCLYYSSRTVFPLLYYIKLVE